MVRIGLKGASSSTGAFKHSSMSSQTSQPSVMLKQKHSLKAVKGDEAPEVPEGDYWYRAPFLIDDDEFWAKVQGFSRMDLVVAKSLLVSTKAPIGSAFFVHPHSLSQLCLERGGFPYSFFFFDYSVKPFDAINVWKMEIIGNADYKERLWT
ncbi:hypothetical protein U1Q18_027903 [Sarracenia purpurea var. burkii]